MQRTIRWQVRTLIGLILSLICGSVIAQEWQLQKSQEPVQVFTRVKADPQRNLDYQEILATTIVSAPPHALINLLEETAKAPEWIDNCIQVTLLSKKTPHINIVQSTFAAPWPLKNRDMVTLSTVHQEGEKIIIEITDAGDIYPQQQNTVRMQHVSGQWTISPKANGLTEIIYQGSGDPAGNIPAWLANKVLIMSTFNTFIKLTQRLNEDARAKP